MKVSDLSVEIIRKPDSEGCEEEVTFLGDESKRRWLQYPHIGQAMQNVIDHINELEELGIRTRVSEIHARSGNQSARAYRGMDGRMRQYLINAIRRNEQGTQVQE